MYKSLVGFVLIFGIVTSFMVFGNPGDSDVEKAINAGNQKFTQGLENKDAAAIASGYTKSAKLLPPNENFVEGSENIKAYWQAFIDGGMLVKLHTMEIYPHGDTAAEVGTWEIVSADGKQIDNGKYIVLWKKEGGSWKLHRDMWSSNNPPATPAN